MLPPQLVAEFSRNGFSPESLLSVLNYSGPAYIWEGPGERNLESRSLRYGYLVIDPLKVIVVHKDVVRITSDGVTEQYPLAAFEGNPFKPVELELSRRKICGPKESNLPPFSGGGIGFVGYDSGRYFERISGAQGHPTEPDLYFLITRSVIAFDYERNIIQLIANGQTGGLLNSLQEKLALSAPDLSCATNSQSTSQTVTYRTLFSRAQFEERVRLAIEYIRAGDIFQLVIGNTLRLEVSPDPLKLYATLKQLNPSPFHYLIRTDSSCFVGASPETMLRGKEFENPGSGERETTVSMRLVAGTYPRGLNPDEDQEGIAKFKADEKERAEHLMLIDHSRNDIGRVSKIGRVMVSDMFTVESYSDLHHLVSQVSGVLRPEESVLSALRSTFPISTLTGTPKIRAMEIIAELEAPSRGIFGGAVVMLDDYGEMDSGVMIRGVSITPEGSNIKVGCGIVNDSIPEREFDECLWKAQAMLRSIGAVLKR